MKKLILFAVMAVLCGLLPAQDQEPAKVEPQAQDIDLKTIHFPQAFIHAGKEYPAGDYRMVLTVKDGQHVFTVSNAQQPEPLFEELAVVKAMSGAGSGSRFRVKKDFLRGKEYFRVKVTMPGQWLMGFFLVRK
jgi:hypothetical protein